MDGHTKLRCFSRYLIVGAIVAATPAFAADQAPPFAAIAKTPDFDAAKIALFLLDPHPKMPDMALSRSEAADLAAYIVSLK